MPVGDLLATFVTAGRYQPQTRPREVRSTELAHLGRDLSLAVKGMYPLLDSSTEQGSSGLGNPVFSYRLYLCS